MLEEKLQNCPRCRTGKLRPTGFVSTGRDAETGNVSNDIRGRKCNNCGYPAGDGQELIGTVNERIGDD